MTDKLTSVKYGRIEFLSDDLKGLFYEKEGMVAIETWSNGRELKMKYVKVNSVRDYMLGLGPFKEVGIESMDLKTVLIAYFEKYPDGGKLKEFVDEARKEFT